MRDAVSLLDQCSVCAEVINAETVSNAAGIAGRDYLYEILDAIAVKDTAKVLFVTGNLYNMSKDLTRLCEELITQLRNIMLIQVSPRQHPVLSYVCRTNLKNSENLQRKSLLKQ